LARTTSIQVRLNIGFRQGQTWRAAIHNDTDTTAVRFTPGGDAKQLPKNIAHATGLAKNVTRSNLLEH
jgi:hypothetical protein